MAAAVEGGRQAGIRRSRLQVMGNSDGGEAGIL